MLFGVFNQKQYRPIGLAIPVRRFNDLKVFLTSGGNIRLTSNAHPPTSFLSPSEFDPIQPLPLTQKVTLLRSFTLQRSSTRSTVNPGLPHPAPSTFRISHPLGGFLLLAPFGLISYQSHSWAFPFRAFSPCRAFEPSQAQSPSCKKQKPEIRLPSPPSRLYSLQGSDTFHR
jgi:hypothetical protein